MTNVRKLIVIDEDASYANADETIAAMWLSQVDAYDSLPRKRRERTYMRFSPSRADACLRELYYEATNATTDDEPKVAWKERRARNGNAYHRETQYHHTKMADVLRAAGLPVNFEVVATEVAGSASYEVGEHTVVIEGRCDVILRYVGETIPGVVNEGDVFFVDYKAKSNGLGRVKYAIPDYTRSQMVAYSMLDFTAKDGERFTGINRVIVHYESLSKPKESEKESKDVHTVIVHATESERRSLLVRLAKVVDAVDKGDVPAAELDKCSFCDFKTLCAKDGGYTSGT